MRSSFGHSLWGTAGNSDKFGRVLIALDNSGCREPECAHFGASYCEGVGKPILKGRNSSEDREIVNRDRSGRHPLTERLTLEPKIRVERIAVFRVWKKVIQGEFVGRLFRTRMAR